MIPQTGNTEADDEAILLLGEVRLHSIAANPAAVGPFGSSRLSWSVTAPQGVTIRLDGLTVAASGERSLLPAADETHRLSAKAGRFSKSLGVVFVHANLSQCTTLETNLLPQVLVPKIKDRIDADDSGIYFRLIPVQVLGPTHFNITTYARSKPRVWISTDRLNIALQLGQVVDDFPDASIDLSVSFGLQVVQVQDPISAFGHRRIVSTNEVINVDISFPFYAWLIPGAMIGLPIAIDNGKEKARARSMNMIREIVGQLPPLHSSEESLNTFFHAPHGTEKHDVRLYIDSDAKGTFAVTYCPEIEPVVVA